MTSESTELSTSGTSKEQTEAAISSAPGLEHWYCTFLAVGSLLSVGADGGGYTSLVYQ